MYAQRKQKLFINTQVIKQPMPAGDYPKRKKEKSNRDPQKYKNKRKKKSIKNC